MIKVPQRYQGYLKPHMVRITALLESGMTTIQIGHVLHNEGVTTPYSGWWTNCPAALSSTIKAAFNRERIEIRRSKPINRWDDLLPAHLAKHQYLWERATLIRRGKLAGLTNVEIGARLGVSASRVSCIDRWLGSENEPSPLERYLNERPLFWGQKRPSVSLEFVKHGIPHTGLSFWAD